MSDMQQDIKDDEIRIISSEKKYTSGSHKDNAQKRKKTIRQLVVVFLSIIAASVLFKVIFMCLPDGNSEDTEMLELTTTVESSPGEDIPLPGADAETRGGGHVIITDTVVNGNALTIFKPENLVATLQVGTSTLDDNTIKLVLQAADIRYDNGGIVGAYVCGGELLSKGQAKSGYCAIIGGKINIGVARSTPFLEQALETGGYFFRQYPLVVGNQVVENKPKGKSLRRALADINGSPVVIMSRESMTFHDFSQTLVDMGVSDAIYLVGGKVYGFAIDPDGVKTEFGVKNDRMPANVNYMVWR